MKMNVIDYAEAKAVNAGDKTKTRLRWPIFLLLLLSVTLGAGCTDYYGGYPQYGPGYGPGYGRGYGPGYAGPGYGYPGGAVTVEVGDRPYYTRGPGYSVGHAYYVWVPGHWSRRHPRVWIHGHYVLRG